MRLITFAHPGNESYAQDRPLALERACPCGCDGRAGPNLGYIHAIVGGKGFSLIAETETEYEELSEMLEVLNS